MFIFAFFFFAPFQPQISFILCCYNSWKFTRLVCKKLDKLHQHIGTRTGACGPVVINLKVKSNTVKPLGFESLTYI